MDKKELRAACLEKIKITTPEKFREWGAEVCNIVTKTEQWKKADTVFVFVSMPTETDTSGLIEKALNMGKRLCVPKIIGDGIMEAVEIKNQAQLSSGKFGIYEPDDTNPSVEKNEIDLVLLPCLAADENGKRLGRGGGYYDRFCEDYTGDKIIVCPEMLLLKDGEIPTEKWDITADGVVTEKRFISAKPL